MQDSIQTLEDQLKKYEGYLRGALNGDKRFKSVRQNVIFYGAMVTRLKTDIQRRDEV